MKMMLESSDSKYSNEEISEIVEKAGLSTAIETHVIYGIEFTGVVFDITDNSNILKFTGRLDEKEKDLIKLLPIY